MLLCFSICIFYYFFLKEKNFFFLNWSVRIPSLTVIVRLPQISSRHYKYKVMQSESKTQGKHHPSLLINICSTVQHTCTHWTSIKVQRSIRLVAYSYRYSYIIRFYKKKMVVPHFNLLPFLAGIIPVSYTHLTLPTNDLV